MKTDRKAKLCIVAAACLVLLSACAPSSQNLILGKWEVQNAPTNMTAQFNSDGTASVTILGQAMHGTCKMDELEWSMNGMSTKAKVKVTASELELTDSSNRTIKYKRK